jgi:hypothetical protein
MGSLLTSTYSPFTQCKQPTQETHATLNFLRLLISVIYTIAGATSLILDEQIRNFHLDKCTDLYFSCFPLILFLLVSILYSSLELCTNKSKNNVKNSIKNSIDVAIFGATTSIVIHVFIVKNDIICSNEYLRNYTTILYFAYWCISMYIMCILYLILHFITFLYVKCYKEKLTVNTYQEVDSNI